MPVDDANRTPVLKDGKQLQIRLLLEVFDYLVDDSIGTERFYPACNLHQIGIAFLNYREFLFRFVLCEYAVIQRAHRPFFRFRKMITLNKRNPYILKNCQFFQLLNALGNDLAIAGRRHPVQAGHKARLDTIYMNVVDEVLVDFDEVRQHLGPQAQSRIPGPKIVERYRETHAPIMGKSLRKQTITFGLVLFCHFDDNTFGTDSELLQITQGLALFEGWICQRAGADVQKQFCFQRQLGKATDGILSAEYLKLAFEPELDSGFEQGNWFVKRAVLGTASQRLISKDGAFSQIHDGLKNRLNVFPVNNGPDQFNFRQLFAISIFLHRLQHTTPLALVDHRPMLAIIRHQNGVNPGQLLHWEETLMQFNSTCTKNLLFLNSWNGFVRFSPRKGHRSATTCLRLRESLEFSY